MMLRLALAPLALLAACTTAPVPALEPQPQTSRPVTQVLYRPADELADMLEGRFSSLPQTEAEIAAAVPEEDRHPALIAHHVGFEGEALSFSGAKIYAQLDRAGETGDRRVYRQRIYLLSSQQDGSVRMSVAEIVQDKRAAIVDGPRTELEALTDADLILFDPGCDAIWTRNEKGWSGVMDPGTCKRLSARRGEMLSIGGTFSIAQGEFTHSEEGFYADGSRLFGRTDGVPNIYTRQ